MSTKVPTELFQAIHSLLSSQGFEKSASALLKEASIKKSSDAENLVEIFSAHKTSKNGKKANVVAKKAASSSDSSSTDSSEDEAVAPAKKPVPTKPAAKVAVKKAESSSDSETSSSSEDEAPAKKSVPASKPAAKPVVAKKADSSSSESSDSEDDSKMAVVKAPVPAKKATPAKKPASSSSSSSSESSSSEDEAPKKPAPVAAKAKTVAPIKKPASSSSSSSDSESSSSSSSDDEAPPKKVAKKSEFTTPAKAAAAVVSTPSTPSSGANGEHKIYVKGLPWLASEAEVRDFFKDCGVITSTECPIGEDGRPTGTAFVKFAARSGLEAAIALDGQLWPGTERWLKIQEGFDKPERRAFAEVGAKPEGCDTVFVGNLPWDVTEEQMREIFGVAGDISSVRFAQGEDGGFRGFGHVSFYDGNCVEEAVKLAGSDVNGRAIRVDFAPPRNRDSAGGGRGGGGRGGGRGDGGRGGGRGTPGRGRGGPVTPNKNKGTIGAGGGSGKKMTFDE